MEECRLIDCEAEAEEGKERRGEERKGNNY